ncbi:hypothetical protein SAY86_008178 [Trapa natans]|uniref:Uncharacterized protein n=1 Tax=Trapa natans TaxID=22666 RepID=A0AAN7QE72_TRANT|nr:hypothetical protein SAY86_008178 [Trapa natans]
MGAGVASSPLCLSPSLASALHVPSSSFSSRLTFSGTTSLAQQPWSLSCQFLKNRPYLAKHACRASSHSFSEEDFLNRTKELKGRISSDFTTFPEDDFCLEVADTNTSDSEYGINFLASIERKASCVDLPLSIRMLKRKLHWKEGSREAGESAYCSIKAGFNSMTFIVKEIQSSTFQMREIPLGGDSQNLLACGKEDLHASFVWLFQSVFSQAPTLMLHLMVFLADFSVHSMACNPAIASALSPRDTVPEVEIQDRTYERRLALPTTEFSISTSTSMARSYCGGDVEEHSSHSNTGEAIFPRGNLTSSSLCSREEEEVDLWRSVVEEASGMQDARRDESLDRQTMKNFVPPVIAKAEADDKYSEHSRTEVLYLVGLSQDPDNSLLLANYAQFLYLVAHDHDRYILIICQHLITVEQNSQLKMWQQARIISINSYFGMGCLRF